MSKRSMLARVTTLPETFLGQVTKEVRATILADAPIRTFESGAVIFSARDIEERVGVVLKGTARTYLHARDGRQVSVRYAQPGVMIGCIAGPRSTLSVQAVTDCTIVEIDRRRLREVVAANGTVGLALISEIARRLDDTYATLAANTFGTMRERVARQLLDLASDHEPAEPLIATVTQQDLADGVGTVREVVARVLRDFRDEHLVATRPGHIELLDPEGIATIVGRWRAG